MEAWALELENGWAEKKEGVGERMDLYPLIKAANIKRLPTSLKTRLFPKGRASGTVALPTPVLMRIP